MSTIALKDLPRFDELDHAAALSIRGGSGCYSRETPSCYPQTPSCYPGVLQQPVYGRQGWGCEPVRSGCGPVLSPYGNMHAQPQQIMPL
ncbi:hypothetical protein [Paraburkholderia sp. BCC1884]|uniref:hypothetical protein n=1 Tax=Paraburkholderia sp. BCC1884 TaxID=2562668 RepID=UPI001181CC30|nr:hypothetical protein [Paraburkholderia sp. BCC1884]